MKKSVSEVRRVMSEIIGAWRENRPMEMKQHIHSDFVMFLPGNVGSIRGREVLIGGFIEFCSNARVLEYKQSQEEIQIIGNLAFVNYEFDMLYERAAYRERSKGRDVWMFQLWRGNWRGIFRTMSDLREERSTIS